jgi:hypothetical protein
MKTYANFLSYLDQFLLEMKNVLDKSCTEKKTLHSIFIFENSAVYMGMWKNFVELGRP